MTEYERFADAFARMRFGCAGQLPQQMVEVSLGTPPCLAYCSSARPLSPVV